MLELAEPTIILDGGLGAAGLVGRAGIAADVAGAVGFGGILGAGLDDEAVVGAGGLYHCRASVVMFQASEVLDLSEVKLAMRLPKV